MGVTLSQKVTLEERTVIFDGAGGLGDSWTVLGTHWADVRPGRGRIRGGEGAQQSRSPVTLILRAAPIGDPGRPRPGQRFASGSRRFSILAVAETDATGRLLRCICEEEWVA